MTRNTNQRRIILETLQDSQTHLTADDVYVRVRNTLPNISLGTVYRNLGTLSDSGEILLIRTPGGSSYFDGNIHPHRHMLCEHCDSLIDIPEENCHVNILEPPGVKLLNYDLLVHCVCANCAVIAKT